MDSQSEEFQYQPPKASFFQGLTVGQKLTEKEKLLRNSIKEGSHLEAKQTTLQDKIFKAERFNKHKRKISEENRDNQQFFQEKIIVEATKGQPKQKNKHIQQENVIKCEDQGQSQKQKSFEDLRIIKPILKAIGDLNYHKPTPIQKIAIPVINSGKDVIASSITGSGKTAAFVIPILQRYYNVAAVGYIRVLIVTPTRELAIQIYEEFDKLNKYTKLEAVLVIGASSIQRQEQSLRNHPEVVIGTPGRIIDVLMNSRSIGIQNLEMIIFDEADKLLELGFQAQIKQIMSFTHEQVQTVMFSATMGKEINQLASITSRKPIRISADPDNKTAEKLHQQVIRLHQNTDEYRQAVLVSVLTNLYKDKVIVFFKTKKQCHRMAIVLGLLGFKACELHGNLSQTQRIQAFMEFKEGKQEYLLATDLAARGLDIKEVKSVINFQLPSQLTKYIHRIGRTARAGCIGTSLTICSDLECLELKKMSKKTGDRLFKLTINDASIKKSIQTIQSLAKQIDFILSEEREEKDIRKAEMELQKLENITEHKDQIYSRPKKQWFISENEKRKIQDQAKEASGVPLDFATKKEGKSKKIKKEFRNRKDRRQHEHNE